MKLITAYIQPHKLADVKQELYKKDIYKMSVTNSLGSGQQKGYTEVYRGVEIEVNLLKKTRIEIGLNDEFVEPAIEAICKGAYSGNIGDGKIFITELTEVVRIRTKEKGIAAI